MGRNRCRVSAPHGGGGLGFWIRILGAVLALVFAFAASASAEVVPGGSSGLLGIDRVDHTVPTPGAVTTFPCVGAPGQLVPPPLGPASLGLPRASLCYHGGSVMHSNDTYDLFWEPNRDYPASSKTAIDTFFGDVAHDSGTFGNPFALSPQYLDTTGRAAYSSHYEGSVDDNTTSYPSTGCPFASPNVVCLTDGELQQEIQHMIFAKALPHDGSQLFTILTPPSVAVCSDAPGTLCSRTSFCGYHSQFTIAGVLIPYVVQPWTVGSACDEPGAYFQPSSDPAMRLVSPLSQSLLGAITNPGFGGWWSRTGSEIGDGASPADAATVVSPPSPAGSGPCSYGAVPVDGVGINGNSYVLQAEFNNAGVQGRDPGSPWCAHSVTLNAQFVAPSPVEPGDVVFFDGTGSTATSVGVGFTWNFGDGAPITNGGSVQHAYGTPGVYSVTLTVTDENGYKSTWTQPVDVLGTLPATPGSNASPAAGTSGTSGATGVPSASLGSSVAGGPRAFPAGAVVVRLLPSTFRNLMRSGVIASVSTDRNLSAFVDLLIPRTTARRAHIKTGRAKVVVVGTGTIAAIKPGQSKFRVRLSKHVAGRLAKLGHLTLSVRLTVIDAAGRKNVVDVARRY